jgi:serine/threonine protein kinase
MRFWLGSWVFYRPRAKCGLYDRVCGYSLVPRAGNHVVFPVLYQSQYVFPDEYFEFTFSIYLVDVWSVGCILAELLGGKPFFKGRDYVDQLNQILHYLGTPNEETLARIGSPRAQEYVRNLPYMPKKSWSSLFPSANEAALDLLDKMLAFDPSSRISVETALEHRYLQIWHDASDEPTCPTTFDFHFEIVEDIAQMKQMILDEVNRFRQFVRQQQPLQPAGHVAQAGNVPIPEGYQGRPDDPRPQEAAQHLGGLEGDLVGMDGAMRT